MTAATNKIKPKSSYNNVSTEYLVPLDTTEGIKLANNQNYPAAGSLFGLIDSNGSQIKIDTLAEYTSNYGVSIEQVLLKDGSINYGVTAGTGSMQTVTIRGIVALTEGLVVCVKLGAALNHNGTLDVNSLGPKYITSMAGWFSPRASGDYLVLMYNGTTFIVLCEKRNAQNAWTPSYSAGGSMTFTSVSTGEARYSVNDGRVDFYVRANGTTGGSAHSELRIAIPFGTALENVYFNAYVADGGNIANGIGWVESSSGILKFAKDDLSNFGLGSGRQVLGIGWYFLT